MNTVITETTRLRLRLFNENDAAFVLQQLNEPSFIQNIADRGVRTLDSARQFIVERFLASYATYGHGLYAVELKNDGTVIGMCGIIKRDELEHADLGYAYLPAYWSRGYAAEAAHATLDYARLQLHKNEVLAIVNHDNKSSIALLDKLGFIYQGLIALYPNEPDLRLYRVQWAGDNKNQ